MSMKCFHFENVFIFSRKPNSFFKIKIKFCNNSQPDITIGLLKDGHKFIILSLKNYSIFKISLDIILTNLTDISLNDFIILKKYSANISGLADYTNNNAQEKVSSYSEDCNVKDESTKMLKCESPTIQPLVINEQMNGSHEGSNNTGETLKQLVLKPETAVVQSPVLEIVSSSAQSKNYEDGALRRHLTEGYKKQVQGIHANALHESPNTRGWTDFSNGDVDTKNLGLFNPTLNSSFNFDLSSVKKIQQVKGSSSQSSPSSSSTGMRDQQSAANQAAATKPRCTPAREAVDPAKYYTLTDEPDGTKYACSKCGNVYKWRKSLNKHWKEKHDGEVPPSLVERERMMMGFPLHLQKHSSMQHPSSHSTSTVRKNAASSFMISPAQSMNSAKNPSLVSTPDYSFDRFSLKALNKSTPSMMNPAKVPSLQQPNQFSLPASQSHAWTVKNQMTRDPSSLEKMKTAGVDSITSALCRNRTIPHTFSPIAAHNVSHALPADFASPRFVSPHQSTMSFEMNENDAGVLDLSCKGAEKTAAISPFSSLDTSSFMQDEPLDFSLKSIPSKSSTKNSAKSQGSGVDQKSSYDNMMLHQNRPTWTHQTSRYPNNNKGTKLNCAQCMQFFSTPSDLNRHFVQSHIELLYEAADELITGFESRSGPQHSTQLYKYLASDQTKSSIQCVVCSVIEESQSKLARHFEQEHGMIEPNPYKSSSFSSLPSDTQFKQRQLNGDSEEFGQRFFHQCDLCSFSTNVRSEFTRHQLKHSLDMGPMADRKLNANRETHHDKMFYRQLVPEGDGGIIDLEAEGTAIVIPKAPEDTTASLIYPSHFNQQNITSKSEVCDLVGLADEGTAIVIPQAPEDSSPESMNYTPPGSKNGRSKKDGSTSAESLLPFKCNLCEYRARWPSEMTQHMKNHSDEKPYQCPQCSYRLVFIRDILLVFLIMYRVIVRSISEPYSD